MRHGSLFSGIGGPDLAADKMGWENIFHCEINPFGQKVLKYYWPNAISYEDIKTTDFSIHRGAIDILTGGFPCQPYSLAGLRKGKEDERHLWPEMLRAIREIKPRWVVGENVLGLVNWNDGLVFEEVQADLEAQGYEIQPYVLPAASVNAPHRRDRVWFIAFNSSYKHDGGYFHGESSGIRVDMDRYKLAKTRWKQGSNHFEPSGSDAPNSFNNNGRRAQSNWNEKGQYIFGKSSGFGIQWFITNTSGVRFCWNDWERNIRQQCGIRRETRNQLDGDGREGYTTDTAINGLQVAGQTGIKKFQKKGRERVDNRFEFKSESDQQYFSWEKFPTQSPICFGDDGLSSRLAGITFPRFRAESIKAGGNAIVHQVILQIFKAIEQYEKL